MSLPLMAADKIAARDGAVLRGSQPRALRAGPPMRTCVTLLRDC